MIRYSKNIAFPYFGKSSSFFDFFYQISLDFLLKVNLGMVYDFILSNLYKNPLINPPLSPLLKVPLLWGEEAKRRAKR